MLLVIPEGELKTIFSEITTKKTPTKLFYLIKIDPETPLHGELFLSSTEILYHNNFFSVW